MRNYDQVSIHHLVEERAAIEACLPKRARLYGGSGGFKTVHSSYNFEPPLTKEEMTGILEKLIDANAKTIDFWDVSSLGQDCGPVE